MISYVNRKNITYYLHLRPTATGKVGYVMTRSSEGALDAIPPGMEIVENVNAQVSVRVRRKRIITEAEEMLVRKELEALALTHYRVEIKNRTIVIYEPHGTSEETTRRQNECSQADTLTTIALQRLRTVVGDDQVDEYLAQKRQEALARAQREESYDPVLQFTLSRSSDRTFTVERMGYFGMGGWRWVTTVSLQEAVKAYLPRLGKMSFFEM